MTVGLKNVEEVDVKSDRHAEREAAEVVVVVGIVQCVRCARLGRKRTCQ